MTQDSMILSEICHSPNERHCFILLMRVVSNHVCRVPYIWAQYSKQRCSDRWHSQKDRI